MDRARRDRPYRRPDDAVAHPRRRQGRDRPEPQARPAQPRDLRRLARIVGRRGRRARTFAIVRVADCGHWPIDGTPAALDPSRSLSVAFGTALPAPFRTLPWLV